MDFIVWGDDWGKHYSTTQHLIHHLSPADRVIWIDSIGMRRPRLSLVDIGRIWHRFAAIVTKRFSSQQKKGAVRVGRQPQCRFKQMIPLALPFHQNRCIRFCNRLLLQAQLARVVAKQGFKKGVVLAANPVAVYYTGWDYAESLIYLRLDEYSLLPGVDDELAAAAEGLMFDRADLIVHTSRKLLPDGLADKSLYLPQGVDIGNFTPAMFASPGKRILGFFGLLAEWLDYELIVAVAKALPDWTLEFVGPVRFSSDKMLEQPNIILREAVPYEELNSAIKDWACGWVPFVVNTLTDSVNPLKLREYLAAGLPAVCTPLKEVVEDDLLRTQVFISNNAIAIASWLQKTFAEESQEKRERRHQAMQLESWDMRIATLKQHEVLRRSYNIFQ